MTIKEDEPKKEEGIELGDVGAVAEAVPMSSNSLLDPKLVELLSTVDGFYIQQRVRWGEAVTQGCCEQRNIYDVFNKKEEGNVKIMVRTESIFVFSCVCGSAYFRG